MQPAEMKELVTAKGKLGVDAAALAHIHGTGTLIDQPILPATLDQADMPPEHHLHLQEGSRHQKRTHEVGTPIGQSSLASSLHCKQLLNIKLAKKFTQPYALSMRASCSTFVAPLPAV
eukprot:5456822-Amphidinium_carterae.1